MTRPLEDWWLREGLVKGEYASDVILLGWLPGHTRRAVAIDLGEGPGIQNGRGQQTLANCKVARESGVLACIQKKLSYKTLRLPFSDKNRQKNVLTSASF